MNAYKILLEKDPVKRKELASKIGAKKIMKTFGYKTLDKNDEYELIQLFIKRYNSFPSVYLKMYSKTNDGYILEGIDSNVETIEYALKWRNQAEGNPIKLT